MKKLALIFVLMSLTATAMAQPLKKCPPDAPYRYRMSMGWIGTRNDPGRRGFAIEVGCLEREIHTEADWEWLQKKIEIEPDVTSVTIMSAVPLAE